MPIHTPADDTECPIADPPLPGLRCCDWRDHGGHRTCACPDHPADRDHPFGYPPALEHTEFPDEPAIPDTERPGFDFQAAYEAELEAEGG
jgi:hypothetical protein